MEIQCNCPICGSNLIRIDDTLWQCSNRSTCAEIIRDSEIREMKKATNKLNKKRLIKLE